MIGELSDEGALERFIHRTVERLGLARRIRVLETSEGWHEVGALGEPAFANSWVNYNSATHATAAFYKDGSGRVHLKGSIKSGTIGATVFTLPVGYRPALQNDFGVLSGTGSGACIITAAGAVVAVLGTNTSFALNSISFRAAN